MTAPVSLSAVPLGPDLAPGRSEAAGMDGFAALLGQLVTMVATAPSGPQAPEAAPEAPAVVEVLDEGAAAAAVACVVVPPPWAPFQPEPLAPQDAAPGAALSEPANPRTTPALPVNASSRAQEALLRHGPAPAAADKGAEPVGPPSTTPPPAAPAVFAAVAERAVLPPVPALPSPATATASVPASDSAVPEEIADTSAVPVPTAPVAGAAATAAPAPLPPTASDPAVGRTENVRPAILEAARGLRQEGEGRVSLVVRLNPPELGSVLVKLTVQDGRVDVQLRTPDLQAVGDLSAQSREVQQVLKDSGFDLSSFDVSHGGVHDQHEEGKTPDRGTTQRERRADGRDEALRVTDDVPEARPAGTWL